MQLILSPYGHRFLLHLSRSGRLERALEQEEVRLLCALLLHTAAPDCGQPGLEALRARGLVMAVDDGISQQEIRRRYARNPLEHLSRVVFEYTTLCNLDCMHCRNGNLEAVATADPAALARVAEAVLPLGIDRFDFIGGEVTLYGRGWLELVRRLRQAGATHTSVLTSGWFLEARDFLAAGRRYADDATYLAALAECGLTHVVFSLDGPEAVHDRCRRMPGLYRRVVAGFEKVRAAGMEPRVSVLVGMGLPPHAARAWIAQVSTLLFGPAESEAEAVRRVLGDESNYASSFIDVGGGAELVQLQRGGRGLEAFSDEQLRCKNFFRPSPTLRIKASGEIALCPLVEGGDGYGNVRRENIVELLNRLDQALIYRLHAERRIGEHRRFLDPEVFAGGLAHACSARVALNMIALAMEAKAVGPEDVQALRAINEEVAAKMGLRPRVMKHRANGHARP